MARRTYCDTCGKEVNRWYKVRIECEGSNPNINIQPLLKRRGTLDICQDCLESALGYLKEEKHDSN